MTDEHDQISHSFNLGALSGHIQFALAIAIEIILCRSDSVPSSAASIFRRVISVLMGLLFGLSLIAAQKEPSAAGDMASLSGKGTDQTGPVVKDVEVVLTTASGVRLEIVVNDEGVYSVSGIYPGTYTLTISAANFADRIIDNIKLTAGGKLTMDATLKPASSQPAVALSAAGQTEQGSAPLSQISPHAGQKIAGDKGAIRGTATDPTGAVVPDAKAALTSVTGEKLETPVNDKGTYSFTGLAPGTYTLIVSAPNFADMSFDNIVLAAGLELTLDASLAPASAKKEEIKGESGGAGQVETETSSVSGTITQKEA